MGAVDSWGWTVVAKQSPNLKLVSKDETAALEKGLGISSGLDFVAIAELGGAEAKRVERLISEVCPRAGVIAVARATLPWDVRPVVVLAGEDTGGSNPRMGTLWAVYDFLQDELGCRWIWPGEIGRVVPRTATVAVGSLDIQETPTIKIRGFRMAAQEKHRVAYEKEGLGRFLEFGATYERISEDERTGRKHYMAEGGDFICVSNFSTATLDLPIKSSQTNTALMFRAFTERIPPRGTPVTLELKPKKKEQPE